MLDNCIKTNRVIFEGDNEINARKVNFADPKVMRRTMEDLVKHGILPKSILNNKSKK